ncbi:YtxH domain-containing protein [Marinilactibacillus piezotolerans]|uniref:YtxH domain-containing protein n=1 Tax=Marinilactibacillus piezotolerans TaxID=258723 RepID=UPI0009B10F64|nr:YtxH domain-containing protein [Marinilactibacillus piezotolerans]
MSKGSFGFGILVGSIAGVASAYLLAQKSGEALQGDLKEQATDSKNKLILKLDELLENTELKLSEQMTDQEVYNPPVDYVAEPETVSAPPEHTALQEDPIVTPEVKR